jgi:hypothetical protein
MIVGKNNLFIMRKNAFKKELSKAFQVTMFEKHAMTEVSRDEHRTGMAFFFLVVPALVNLFLASLTVRHFSQFHMQTLAGGLVISILAIFIASYIAEKGFHGTALHMGFFRVVGYGSFVGWLNIVTYLFFLFGISGLSGLRSTISFVTGIWMLIIFYKALRNVHSLKEGDAMLAMIATVVAVLFVQGIFIRLFDFTGGIIF